MNSIARYIWNGCFSKIIESDLKVPVTAGYFVAAITKVSWYLSQM